MTNTQTLFTPNDAQIEQQHALSSYLKTLEGSGVDVDRVELTESDDVELEYTAQGEGIAQVAHELRYIAGSFLPVQGDGGLGDLEVTMQISGDNTGSWCVKREWGEKFRTGEWNDKRYLKHVQATLEGVN